MQVTYFASDLSDAAVERRVRMLRIGGAEVKLLGFRRTPTPVPDVDGVPAIDLGQTFDAKLASRCTNVLRRSLENWREAVAGSDVVLARNLDMLTIATAAKTRARSPVRLAYECLDIHAALVGSSLPSKLLRVWEKRLLRCTDTLIVSSPSYLTHYYDRLGIRLPHVIVAENKRVLPARVERPLTVLGRQPPWRIGWFGILRCVESFHMLFRLARRHPSLVDITLRGRPVRELHDLISRYLPVANMRFSGSYTQDDLGTIYGSCDLTWGIEYFDRGGNSDWALCNRLYEGGYYNTPAVALAETAMGDWLKARRAGVLLRDPYNELEPFITGLTGAGYRVFQLSAAYIPTRDFVWTIDECRDFVCKIAGR